MFLMVVWCSVQVCLTNSIHFKCDFRCVVAVQISEHPPVPSAAPTPEKSESLSKSEIETRVSAAWSLVAAELSITTDEVLDFIDLMPLYAFSVENNLDLLDVVRQTYKRSSTISKNLDILAIEANCDRKELGLLLNWFDVFEYAKQQNQTDVMAVMREAMTWARDKNKNPGKQSSKLKRLEGLSERELNRMKQFKGYPDGRATRSEARTARINNARNKKLEEQRGKGSSSWFSLT